MYGTQTITIMTKKKVVFENDVKMYGTQTDVLQIIQRLKFENDVKFIFVNNKNR